MNVSFQRTYRSKNGNATFVYTVKGSQEDLAAYKEAQGNFFRENEHGVPLWFTTRFIGNTGTLVITSNGNIVPDMSQFDKAASLAEQYGGNFGQELAQASAQQILGISPAPAAPAAPVHAPDAQAPELGDM
jgi:hypothetical protein